MNKLLYLKSITLVSRNRKAKKVSIKILMDKSREKPDISKQNIIDCDSRNDLIVKFDRFGNYLRKWGKGLPSPDFQFNDRGGILIDSDDYLYVSDTGNNMIHIFTDNESIFNITGWSGGETFIQPE